MHDLEERIRPINIEDEMRDSYISYAMSVIISRALPDVRDGLKPVHRRVIYAMRGLGLGSGRPYRKSARIVGEVMGKYHPHGDQAIYDTLVRMAQSFSMRYALVDGQGNFGSVDGDPAAAMRYTEARMTRLTESMLADLDKETVDFVPTFDESETEPTVLPSMVPNLLINGSTGIAVGMATNVPPHNLREVIDGVIAMIDDPDITLPELMQHIPGPDFPTGGMICGRGGIRQAYKTGRGKLLVRAVAGLETAKSGKQSIIVSEIPYTVNKARLIEETARLVQDKKLEGIADIRDESDRDGMRIVIDLKRGENYEVILNNLYKHTRMQTTFGVIILALVDNRPVFLTLREALRHFIGHRRDIIYRRTRFELRKAEARAHILEGLRIALDHIDEVIKLIRASKDTDTARTGLMESFGLTKIQAQAILDMRLQRLTGLERDKIEQEYKELLQAIERYRQILANPALVMEIMKEELTAMREKFGDGRKTVIVDAAEDIDIEDLIAEENMVVTISHAGYIKRIATSTYRQQARGGRGKTAMQTKDEDFVEQIFIASTHHYMLFFTSDGRVFRKKVYELPQTGRASRGKAMVNMFPIEKGVKVTAVLAVEDFGSDKFVMMATRQGTVKKVELSAFANVRANGIIAVGLAEEDALLGVQLTSGENEIILGTRNGRAIRFKEEDVRAMGRTAAGVRGIKLKSDDVIVGMVVARPEATLLSVTENGYGKRTDVADYRLIGRGGQGVLDIKTTTRNGKVVGILAVNDDEDVMMITHNGIAIRTAVSGISIIGRNTQGVRVIRCDDGDRLVAVAKIKEE